MTVYLSRRISALVALAAAVIAAGSSTARAEYRVGPGDVVEISVVGIADLQRRATVELDGSISLPLAGTIQVDGLTIAELRADVKSAVSGRSFARSSPDGARTLTVVDPDDVIVSIAAYRPVFVKGDVAKPGEYPYRGRMTIREAVALAGGFLASPFKSAEDVAIRDLDIRGEVETLWLEAAKERARVWRTQVLTGESKESADVIGQSVPLDAPVKRAAIAALEEHSARQVEMLEAAHKTEVEAVKGIIGQLDQEIEITTKQVADEEQAYKIDLDELNSLGRLQEKGVVTSQRFSDARRAVVFSSTRVLQTASRLSDLKRLKMERELQVQKLATDRKAALYIELEAATARLAEVRAKLRSASEKLQFSTAGRSRVLPAKGLAGLVVYRRSASKIERLVETEDTMLEPGDVIEVSIDSSNAAGSAAVSNSN